ncbi:hypothetical protein JHL18_15330 [Clostridium sp. YIM B02505]|uniref:Beta-ketoacyl synthase C-terminal domain-containing protein n=1 Tax=Clostridium yunnanense TaxID=2800325 RepID=A0ABS1ERT0_9CLOT|nr:hypothetical protein [Clostridium yunnanense]MBK1811993.1 hypothetical protein [Clostridium yunnanense]
MKKIFITGMGIISNVGVTLEELWSNLNKSSIDDISEYTLPIKIPLIISKPEVRRMSRYAYMAVYSTKIIADKRDDRKSKLDRDKTGTIFNTGYGPLSTNIKFGESVIKGNADFASPTVFSSTVSNACVGNVCMINQLKGPSTILLGSNNIGYSYELIRDGLADGIFTGGIEEYCRELFQSFEEISSTNTYINEGFRISEGAATILMESLDEKSEEYQELKEEIFCEIIGYSDKNMGAHPAVLGNIEFDSDVFASNMESLLKAENIKAEDVELIVNAKSGIRKSDEAEAIAIKKIFSKEVLQISPKRVVGETLGASLTINTVIAALCLKQQAVPSLLSKDNSQINKTIRYAIVNGYDVSGNTTSILLKAVDKGDINNE